MATRTSDFQCYGSCKLMSQMICRVYAQQLQVTQLIMQSLVRCLLLYHGVAELQPAGRSAHTTGEDTRPTEPARSASRRLWPFLMTAMLEI